VFLAGTVMHNPVTGEYARLVEHTGERAVGELFAVPGGAVAGPHLHPGQEERFEVVEGVLGYRLGDRRGELRRGERSPSLRESSMTGGTPAKATSARGSR